MKASQSLARVISIACAVFVSAAAHCQVNTWALKAHMLTSRRSFAASTGADGRIYVFGGQGPASSDSIKSAEAYDPASDTWSSIADMPKGRTSAAAVTGIDGKIYIFGGVTTNNNVSDFTTGTSAMAYDPVSDSYTPIADIPDETDSAYAALGNDGNIYLVLASGIAQPAVSDFYNVTTGTWSALGAVPPLPAGSTTCAGPGGLIYLMGGNDTGSHIVASVEAFDAHANIWSNPASMGTARLYPAAAGGGDQRLYVMGGFDTNGDNVKSAEAYEPINNSWSSIPDMHVARADASGVEGPDGKVYVMGGQSDGNIVNTVECFQPNLIKGEGTKLASQEGQEYNDLLARFTDLDTAQTAINFSASVSWGDGTPNGVATVVPDAAPGTFKIIGDHTYAEASGYDIQINLQDSDGEAIDLKSHITVSDAALTGAANNFSPSVNILYTGTVATLTDGNPLASASDYTGTIDWGDGASDNAVFVSTGPGAFNINGSHTYTNQGAYQVKVTVNDVDGSTLSLTGSATVVIPPPHVVACVFNSVEGALFKGQLATFTDDSPNVSASSFSATINWGDGTTTTGNVVANGSGGFNVTGNHLYAEEGLYATTVTVSVASGGSVSAIGTALVADAPLTATGYNLTSKTTNFSDTVATFTDADPAGTTSDYTAGIVWGDGKSSSGTIIPFGSGWKVVGTHSYLKKGRYVVTVNIKDAGGATASATTNVNVGPVK
jgi:N-acetylneuraminic acid mutarotase